jgi:hypothetical protein
MRFHLDRRAAWTLGGAVFATLLLALNSGFDWWRPSAGFRHITGYGLLAISLGMWLLPLRRASAGGASPGYRRWHETGGLAMLGGLLLHAANLRTTLLVLLAGVLLILATLGALHPNFAAQRSERYLKAWWTAHIFLGCAASALMLVHVWAMIAY